jgi:hypothetical protein
LPMEQWSDSWESIGNHPWSREPNDVETFLIETPGLTHSEVNQDVMVYITRTGEKYHRSGCRYLRQSRIPTMRASAIGQGYGRCSVCSPP